MPLLPQVLTVNDVYGVMLLWSRLQQKKILLDNHLYAQCNLMLFQLISLAFLFILYYRIIACALQCEAYMLFHHLIGKMNS